MSAQSGDVELSTSRYAGALIMMCLIFFAGLQQFLPTNYRNIIGVTLLVALGGIAFAAYLTGWVLSHPEGSAEMIAIANSIREGLVTS